MRATGSPRLPTIVALVATAAGLASALTAQTPPAPKGAERTNATADPLVSFVQPFVAEWCGHCHGGADPEAGMHLLDLFKKPPKADAAGMLRDVRGALAAREMPPDDEPAPPDADRARMIAWIDQILTEQRRNVDPGRVTMRRLSRVEYRNTMRDLFGVTDDVTTGFPADDLGYGFDNIGGTLSVSVLHLEKYAAAAQRVAESAIVCADREAPKRRRFEAEDLTKKGRVRAGSEHAVFISRGRVEVPVDAPRRGRYVLRVRAFGQQAGDEPTRMAVWVGGDKAETVDVTAERDRPGSYEIPLALPAGRTTLELEFVNDFYDPKVKDRSRRDRNLFVDSLEVVGPVDRRKPTPAHEWIFAYDPGNGEPEARSRPILRRLMRRAWRRPVTRDEVKRMSRLVAQAVADGDAFEQGMQLALQAILVSPHFLFRIEPGGTVAASAGAASAGAASAGAASAGAAQSERLDDFALASRLSFFLWSSLPDAPLMRLAADGRLQDPGVLAAQARRMLRDERASALATNFAAQWLELRSLEDVTPDRDRFASFTPALRRAMAAESELFFRAVLRDGLPARTLLDADFTFVNEALAAHYGIPGVSGPDMRRVRLADRHRGGLIGQASIQTVTSNPTRTSPVKRGKWILENLLDDPPPPPKPGTDSFAGGADLTVVATMREQLAAHRKESACAVCHDRMDALGLAMENYDAIGRWREADHGQPIDASGRLPDGRALSGPESLKRELAKGDAFRRCLLKKLFLYGIGREVRGTDELVLDGLVESLGADASIEAMILGIVGLDAFRRRLVIETK